MPGRSSPRPLPRSLRSRCRSCRVSFIVYSVFCRLAVLTWNRYPEELADKKWDNVGLLVGNSDTDSQKKKPRVLVTNDLTFQVAVDAIGQGASVIVSYRKYS